ncbi:hypothetical protein GLYMA_12G110000v4 [Glycine max]|uniref:Uncharacterized protein n=1 Tax=Glycine max TaxID=3847 RepID=K7LU61_SOYBN|nr:hypothetical protein GYH30_033371 [Glycine max]KRH25537.1 hypothetical protein GLYMA_12G110000v4 [Glycine max]
MECRPSYLKWLSFCPCFVDSDIFKLSQVTFPVLASPGFLDLEDCREGLFMFLMLVLWVKLAGNNPTCVASSWMV